jgi:anti-sigma factor RsiW
MTTPTPTPPSPACRDVELSLGALVLGALEPAERPALEAHLASCPRCTAILADLAPLPGLLHRLNPIERSLAEPSRSSAPQPQSEPTPLAPPPELLERLVGAARRERARRRRRTWAAAVAAAAVLLGVVLAGTITGGRWGDDQPPSATVASATDAHTNVRADVRLTADAWGSALALRLTGVAPEEHCSLVAIDDHGRRDVASTWVATYEGAATVTGHTSFRSGQITRVVVVTADGRTLVRVPIRG